MCVNTQSHAFKHKRKQGVKSSHGDDFYDSNTGNMPHVLPVKGFFKILKNVNTTVSWQKN